jgi:hypothetical protein
MRCIGRCWNGIENEDGEEADGVLRKRSSMAGQRLPNKANRERAS